MVPEWSIDQTYTSVILTSANDRLQGVARALIVVGNDHRATDHINPPLPQLPIYISWHFAYTMGSNLKSFHPHNSMILTWSSKELSWEISPNIDLRVIPSKRLEPISNESNDHFMKSRTPLKLPLNHLGYLDATLIVSSYHHESRMDDFTVKIKSCWRLMASRLRY